MDKREFTISQISKGVTVPKFVAKTKVPNTSFNAMAYKPLYQHLIQLHPLSLTNIIKPFQSVPLLAEVEFSIPSSLFVTSLLAFAGYLIALSSTFLKAALPRSTPQMSESLTR